eukprot:6427731-Amphidinium_carterae.1
MTRTRRLLNRLKGQTNRFQLGNVQYVQCNFNRGGGPSREGVPSKLKMCCVVQPLHTEISSLLLRRCNAPRCKSSHSGVMPMTARSVQSSAIPTALA